MTAAAAVLVALLTPAPAGPAPELRVPRAPVAPIVHQSNFRGERELFGYAPWFRPNVACFGPDGRPFLRVAVVPGGAGPSWEGGEAFVQTLDAFDKK